MSQEKKQNDQNQQLPNKQQRRSSAIDPFIYDSTYQRQLGTRTGLYFGLARDRKHFDGFRRVSDYMTYASDEIDLDDISDYSQMAPQIQSDLNKPQSSSNNDTYPQPAPQQQNTKGEQQQAQCSFLNSWGKNQPLPQFDYSSVKKNTAKAQQMERPSFLSPEGSVANQLRQFVQSLQNVVTVKKQQKPEKSSEKPHSNNEINTQQQEGRAIQKIPSEKQKKKDSAKKYNRRSSILKNDMSQKPQLGVGRNSQLQNKKKQNESSVQEFVFIDRTHYEYENEEFDMKDPQQKQPAKEPLSQYQQQVQKIEKHYRKRVSFAGESKNKRKSVRFSDVRHTKNILTNSFTQQILEHKDSNTHSEQVQDVPFREQEDEVAPELLDNQSDDMQPLKRKLSPHKQSRKSIMKSSQKAEKQKSQDKQINFNGKKLPDEEQTKHINKQIKEEKKKNPKNRKEAKDRVSAPKETKSKPKRSRSKFKDRKNEVSHQKDTEPKKLKTQEQQQQQQKIKRKTVKIGAPKKKAKANEETKPTNIFEVVSSNDNTPFETVLFNSNQSHSNQQGRYPRRNRLATTKYWENQKPFYKGNELIGVNQKKSILALMNCKEGRDAVPNEVTNEDKQVIHGLITIPPQTQITCVLGQNFQKGSLKLKYNYKYPVLFDDGLSQQPLNMQQSCFPGQGFSITNENHKEAIVKVSLIKVQQRPERQDGDQ